MTTSGRPGVETGPVCGVQKTCVDFSTFLLTRSTDLCHVTWHQFLGLVIFSLKIEEKYKHEMKRSGGLDH